MFVTNVLRAKPKNKFILVSCQSMLSTHKVNLVRERLAEKYEFMHFDPYVQADSVYKELKKLRSVKNWKGPLAVKDGVNTLWANQNFRRMQ